MDWLANFQALEQWQQALAIIIASVTLAAIYGATKFGILQGKAGAAAPGATSTAGAAVAAMIVDSTALNNFAAQVAGLKETLDASNVLAGKAIEKMEGGAKAAEVMSERLDTLSDEVRRHAKEVRELTESRKG